MLNNYKEINIYYKIGAKQPQRYAHWLQRDVKQPQRDANQLQWHKSTIRRWKNRKTTTKEKNDNKGKQMTTKKHKINDTKERKVLYCCCFLSDSNIIRRFLPPNPSFRNTAENKMNFVSEAHSASLYRPVLLQLWSLTFSKKIVHAVLKLFCLAFLKSLRPISLGGRIYGFCISWKWKDSAWSPCRGK